ncbi:MAG: hypothetical protein J07HQW1_01022 [Haloquadratum walsbyi J07HQW1]|jgi:hypothetical protein|uniref:Uncharacterized protein n=1 Tax=Haloquadratum walsbyi J07HQW1 TaxID=1238424 RepID=U1PFU6_9EURY|nr:MAG: hypothetical protein J07HQW1_01022 [Haloquadratum walsbyi J07HQW1]
MIINGASGVRGSIISTHVSTSLLRWKKDDSGVSVKNLLLQRQGGFGTGITI